MKYTIECVIDGKKISLTTESPDVGYIGLALSLGIKERAKYRGELKSLDEVSKVAVYGGVNLGGSLDLISVYRSGSRTL